MYIYIYIYIYKCEPEHIHARSEVEQREVEQSEVEPRQLSWTFPSSNFLEVFCRVSFAFIELSWVFSGFLEFTLVCLRFILFLLRFSLEFACGCLCFRLLLFVFASVFPCCLLVIAFVFSSCLFVIAFVRPTEVFCRSYFESMRRLSCFCELSRICPNDQEILHTHTFLGL